MILEVFSNLNDSTSLSPTVNRTLMILEVFSNLNDSTRLSPTVNPTTPRLLNHVLKCHIYTFFEHLQGWRLHQCPGQSVPTLDHSFSQEFCPKNEPDQRPKLKPRLWHRWEVVQPRRQAKTPAPTQSHAAFAHPGPHPDWASTLIPH